jgi:hypothetical protein
VAQWKEHPTTDPKFDGSNPATPAAAGPPVEDGEEKVLPDCRSDSRGLASHSALVAGPGKKEKKKN